MKNIIYIAASMLALAFISTSCQKTTNEIEEPTPEKITKTFKMVIADPETKFSISDTGKSTWQPGDAILVHGEGSTNRTTVVLTKNDISEDGKEATITVEGITPYDRLADGYVSTYYACYPASAVNNGNLYYYANFKDSNNILMAAYNVDDTFIFHNICGIITFKVEGEFNRYAFSGNNDEVVGYTTFQSKIANTTSGPTLNYKHHTEGPLTTIYGNIPNPDGKTTCYICIPDGVNLTKGFNIKFLDDDTIIKTASNKTPVNLERGKVLPLGDITSHLKDYTYPTIVTPTAIDLSDGGTANCYIVTDPGIYKFPAVKGNSDQSVGTVASVHILWETWNNDQTVTQNSVVKAVDQKDNWIYIQIPDNPHAGNAMVAAKDSNGDILWSWHIWVPATTISTGTYSLAAIPIMDRNLGALKAATWGTADPAANGLIYQWGRKDPFPGPKSLSSGTLASIAGTAPSVEKVAVSIETAVANPTTAYLLNNSTWTTASTAALWNNEGSKTMYDPCPRGYKVPRRSDIPAFFIADLSTITGWESSNDYKQFRLGNPATVFQTAGYIDDYSSAYSVSRVGERTAIWSADVSGVKAYAEDIRLDGSTWQIGSPAQSRGANVRCVSEAAAPAFQNKPGMPVMGSYVKISVGAANELSGLCLKNDKSALWGVGDSGHVYSISFDGVVTQVWYHDADMEGITQDPTTGYLYVAIEGSQKVYRLDPDKFADADENAAYETVFYVQEAVDGQYGNSGLEGITWYKDNQVYVGSQYGATLWLYNINGTKVSKKLLPTVAFGIEEVGGLFYDSVTDLLWISDSEAHKIFVVKGDVSELMAVYDVSFNSNAESICVDHEHSCVWLGCDSDTESKIYKISFTGL